jgi:hypothetical protein
LRKGFDGESAFGREQRVRCDDRARIVFGRWELSAPANPRQRLRSKRYTDGHPDGNADCCAHGEADGNADSDRSTVSEAIDCADRYADRNARADGNADERPDDECLRAAVAFGTVDLLFRIDKCTRADRLCG